MVCGKEISSKLHQGCVSTLDKEMHGASSLKIQKMLLAMACMSDEHDMQILDQTLPGSLTHLKQIRDQGTLLVNRLHVDQVVSVLAARHNLVKVVAEERLCMGLKLNEMCNNMVVKSMPLWSTKPDEDNCPSLRKTDMNGVCVLVN